MASKKLFSGKKVLQGSMRETARRAVMFLICCLVVVAVFALRSDRGFEYMTDPFVEAEEYEPASGEVFSQTLPDGKKTIRALSVKFGTSGRVNKGLVTVSFIKNDKTVRQWNVDSDLLKDQEYRKFIFDRPLSVKEEDHCSFTVSQSCEEENNISLRMSEDRAASYRLTLINGAMRSKNLLPFVIVLVLLSIAAAALIDFQNVSVFKMILIAFALFVIMETFTTDLMRRIVSEIPVRAYTWKGATTQIDPEEEWEEVIDLRRADFSTLRIPVGKGDGQSSDLSIRLTQEESGKTYFDRDITKDDMVGGGPTGKAVRITAEDGSFPRGTYRILIRNKDDSKKLRISIQDDGRGGQTINYQAILDSGLGYRIARIVLLLLGAYVIAVCVICGAEKFSVLRFFMVSVIPLSLVYLILMLPWSTPDTGSHIMAANRFSNILTGADRESEWDVRADDAVLFPDSETLYDERNPRMKDYAEIYLNGKTGVQDRTPVNIGTDEKMIFYTPVNYLPEVIGITLAKLLGLGTVPMLYLGRILILLAYIAACAHAIKIVPTGKVIIAATALLPISMMISSSISYDAMVMIATLCFTASILRAAELSGYPASDRNGLPASEKGGRSASDRNGLPASEKSGRLAIIECAVWAAVIGSVKGGGYLLLLPLVLLLFSDDLAKSLRKAVPILLAGGLSALLSDVILPAGSLFQFGGEISGKMSFSYALTHPGSYLSMMMKSYVQYADSLLFGIGGTRLAWAEDTIPDVVIAGLIICTAVYALHEKDRLRLVNRDRIVFLAIIAALLLTMPAMLLSWTSDESDMIMGLQGRYYLPVLPLLLLVITKFPLNERAGGQIPLNERKGRSISAQERERKGRPIPSQEKTGKPIMPQEQSGRLISSPEMAGSLNPPQEQTDRTNEQQTAAGRRFMMTFCLLSCLCVYYMMRLYLTR